MSNAKTTRPRIGGQEVRVPAPPSMPVPPPPPPSQRGPSNPLLALSAAVGGAMDAGFARSGLVMFCTRCVRREKAAGKEAAEAAVRRAVTWQAGEYTCYEDFRPDGGWTGA